MRKKVVIVFSFLTILITVFIVLFILFFDRSTENLEFYKEAFRNNYITSTTSNTIPEHDYDLVGYSQIGTQLYDLSTFFDSLSIEFSDESSEQIYQKFPTPKIKKVLNSDDIKISREDIKSESELNDLISDSRFQNKITTISFNEEEAEINKATSVETVNSYYLVSGIPVVNLGRKFMYEHDLNGDVRNIQGTYNIMKDLQVEDASHFDFYSFDILKQKLKLREDTFYFYPNFDNGFISMNPSAVEYGFTNDSRIIIEKVELFYLYIDEVYSIVPVVISSGYLTGSRNVSISLVTLPT